MLESSSILFYHKYEPFSRAYFVKGIDFWASVPYNKRKKEIFMRTVKLEKITKEAFAPFGEYYTMTEPEGYPLCGEIHKFFPDRLTVHTGGANMAFSPLLVKKPEKMIINAVEYHTTTAEVLIPMNDDMILHVAPPSAGKPVPEHTKAFLVPKNTVVKMRACVWHLAPLPANAPELVCTVVLPEATYMNDCTVVELSEGEQFIIEV